MRTSQSEFLNDFTVNGRLLLQDIWNLKLDWDDAIPEALSKNWWRWFEGLKIVEEINIPRCFSPNLNSAESIQVHIFTDASDKVFSAIAYIRISQPNDVNVSILMSKVRTVSRKKVTSSINIDFNSRLSDYSDLNNFKLMR